LNSDFVAVEVRKQAYLFLNGEPLKSAGQDPTYRAKTRYLASRLTPVSRDSDFDSDPYETILVFQHSPLHDHESLWWVIAYFTFRRRLVSDRRSATKVTKQELAASSIFNDRLARFTSSGALVKRLSCFHSSIRPLGTMLERMRQTLVAGYRKASFHPGSWDDTLSAVEAVLSTFEIDKKLSIKASIWDGCAIQPLTRSDQENRADIDKEQPFRKRKRQTSQDTPAYPGGKGTRGSAKRARLECETPLDAPSMQTRSQTTGRSRRHK
ncbi:hypothetical protein PHLCEN_2v7956, partial [Hermanssonia centrifuga]